MQYFVELTEGKPDDYMSSMDVLTVCCCVAIVRLHPLVPYMKRSANWCLMSIMLQSSYILLQL